MREEEMRRIGHYIATVLKDIKNEATIKKVGAEVHEMAQRFPLYPE
jgi:glycine hydroxymethyltransferase